MKNKVRELFTPEWFEMMRKHDAELARQRAEEERMSSGRVWQDVWDKASREKIPCS